MLDLELTWLEVTAQYGEPNMLAWSLLAALILALLLLILGLWIKVRILSGIFNFLFNATESVGGSGPIGTLILLVTAIVVLSYLLGGF